MSTIIEEYPPQPVTSKVGYENIGRVRDHFSLIQGFARENEGHWVPFWTSPSKNSAKLSRVTWRSKLCRNPLDPSKPDWVTDRQGVNHGVSNSEMWSIRIFGGVQIQIRFNGEWYAGDNPIPHWIAGNWATALEGDYDTEEDGDDS